MPPVLQDRDQLARRFIQRVVATTDRITWFGGNSIARSIARAAGELVEDAHELYLRILGRRLATQAEGDDLRLVAAEEGVQERPPARSQLLLIVQPVVHEVVAIAAFMGGSGMELTTPTVSDLTVGMSIRVSEADGSASEIKTITAIAPGAGAGGGAVVGVSTLTGTYTEARILVRATVPADTLVETSAGVDFQTLTTLITGDRNPVMAGESQALALADKVWCEATVEGAAGNVDARAVTGLATPIAGVVSVFNPERAIGGEDDENDFELRRRVVEVGAVGAQETQAWLEALAREANAEVLRLRFTSGPALNTIYARVLRRTGGTFTTGELSTIAASMQQRSRTGIRIQLDNVIFTAVEVEADIALASGTLQDAWRAIADRLATRLDLRVMAWGGLVDDAELLAIVRTSPGVANVNVSTFLPAADVEPDEDSLPLLARLSLRDTATGDTFNGDLAVGF